MQTFRSGPAALSLLMMGCGAHVPAQAADPVASASAAAAPCLPGGTGYLRATLRGVLVAELDWRDAQLSCEGSTRPDGHGIRVTIAGPLPSVDAGSPPRRLRFVFGIDTSGGEATERARATNLTAIIEGQQQVYSTRGDSRCTVDRLSRTPLDPQGGGQERVEARGFCTGPASSLDGAERLLVTTFDFAAALKTEEATK